MSVLQSCSHNELFSFMFREKKMVEINFLCVHKKLRSKRVAPVLIREITRRVNLQGIFQAVYTAGVVLPKPVGTCRWVLLYAHTFSLLSLLRHWVLTNPVSLHRYWHRSLNPRKLIEVKFSHLSRNMTMQRTMKLYRLPEVSENTQIWQTQIDYIRLPRLHSSSVMSPSGS